MSLKTTKNINVLEFTCEAPLRFYEHCSSCPRFSDHCPDLALGKEVLRGRTKVAYGDHGPANSVHATSFTCLAPLNYFERTRTSCAHAGRCREEGLLLALLDGKKTLDYSKKDVAALPQARRGGVAAAAKREGRRVASS